MQYINLMTRGTNEAAFFSNWKSYTICITGTFYQELLIHECLKKGGDT